MKFDITIKDASREDLRRLTDFLAPDGIARVVEQLQTEIEVPIVDLQEKPKVAPKMEKPETPEIDADGLPWDERIHSENKKLKADGTWWKKRGVSDEEYNAVVDELNGEGLEFQPEQAFASMPEAQFVPVEQTSPAPVQPAPAPVQPAPVQQITPEPVQQAPVQQITPEPVQPKNDLNSILIRIQKGFSSGVVDPTYAKQLVHEVNQATGQEMSSITDMINNQQLLDVASQILSSKGL